MPFKLCYLRELDKALFKEVAYEAMLVQWLTTRIG